MKQKIRKMHFFVMILLCIMFTVLSYVWQKFCLGVAVFILLAIVFFNEYKNALKSKGFFGSKNTLKAYYQQKQQLGLYQKLVWKLAIISLMIACAYFFVSIMQIYTFVIF